MELFDLHVPMASDDPLKWKEEEEIYNGLKKDDIQIKQRPTDREPLS